MTYRKKPLIGEKLQMQIQKLLDYNKRLREAAERGEPLPEDLGAGTLVPELKTNMDANVDTVIRKEVTIREQRKDAGKASADARKNAQSEENEYRKQAIWMLKDGHEIDIVKMRTGLSKSTLYDLRKKIRAKKI